VRLRLPFVAEHAAALAHRPPATNPAAQQVIAERRAWRRELLAEQIHSLLWPGLTEQETQTAAEHLLGFSLVRAGLLEVCRHNR
jgi:hypothetical protein